MKLQFMDSQKPLPANLTDQFTKATLMDAKN